MPTGLEETLGAITGAFSLYEASGRALGGTVASSRSLQEKFLEEAGNCTIFEAPPRDSKKDNPPVRSPVFEALFGIYEGALPRRSYVFWAPPSTGKSAAAKHLMQCLPKLPNAPHGLMISGIAQNDDYFAHMSSLLGASGSTGWARALIQALAPDPREKRLPSILILDEYNSPGPNDINISFARMFFKAFVDENVYVVFITQNERVANTLCDLNLRSKITALPTAVNNPDAQLPQVFNWKDFLWGRKLLTEFLECLDKKGETPHPDIFEGKDDEGAVPWINEPMTPHNARWIYESRIGERIDIGNICSEFLGFDL